MTPATPINLFDILVEQVEDYSIVAMDVEGRIVHWNRGAEKITGYKAVEVMGKRVDMLFTPEDRADGAPDKEFEIATRVGQAADERWHLRADGSRFWAYGLMVSVKSPEGQLIGFGKFLRDRTDLKQLQETLLKQNTALKNLEEGRRHFMATLAHELRTPLHVLTTSTHLLGRLSAKDEQAGNELARIERQIRLINNLVSDLADLSRVERNKIRLEMTEMDLGATAKESCGAVQSLVHERDHVMEMVLPEHPVLINGDAARVQQIIVNLLTNAVRYTPPGGDIGVSLQQEEREAVIRIIDNGVGIPADRLANIFELFTQVHDDYSETPAGMGIGLTLTKELVKLHGGTIQARSDGPGKGSEFTVRLPLLKAPPPT